MTSFNLLYEPWIPAESRNGTVREYSLLDVLLHAHELVSVVDAAPPFEFGLYRLLIALVADGIEDFRRLEDLLQREGFDRETLLGYVTSIGESRFDLFHAEHPFLQTVMSNVDKDKPVAGLFFHLPSGTNVTHFQHGLADGHAITPAVCARALCSFAPFMTSGGSGYSPSINGTPPWYLLVRGRNLRETLLLNTYAGPDLKIGRDGPPAWRSDTPVIPKQERQCASILEALTWRPRAVQLIPGAPGTCTYSGKYSDVLISRVRYAPGFKFSGTDLWSDPAVAYATSDKGRQPIRPREERELWRDVGPMLLLREADYESEKVRIRFSRPLVVDQIRWLKQRGFDSQSEQEIYEAYGMRADKAKVFEWRRERLSLPEAVGSNPTAGAQVQGAMELADEIAGALRSAMKVTYPRDGKGNPRALDRLIQQSQAAFWSDLYEEFRRQFLPQLSAQDPSDFEAPAALITMWKAVLWRRGLAHLNRALGPLDTNAVAIKRQVLARRFFAARCQARLGPHPDRMHSDPKGVVPS